MFLAENSNSVNGQEESNSSIPIIKVEVSDVESHSGEEQNFSDDSSDVDYKPSGQRWNQSKQTRKMNINTKRQSESKIDSHSKKQTPRPPRPVKRTNDGKFIYSGYTFMEVNDGFKCCSCPNRIFKRKGGILVHIRLFHLGIQKF